MTQTEIDFVAPSGDGHDVGARKRDRGIADALSHYAVETIRLTIRVVAQRQASFTADDVLEDLPAATRDSLRAFPNALGACFRAAAKANEIRDTGRAARSRHAGARKRKVAVWEMAR